MRLLVTGSAGHLGEGLMRALPDLGYQPVGLDLKPGPYTDHTGTLTDRPLLAQAMEGCGAVLHTATLHKPHVGTHSKQDFVETNVAGTLAVLETAAAQGVKTVIFTSTTSAFGDALTPAPGDPAAWIDESVRGLPKNIYGATKTGAEDLCALFAYTEGLHVIILRTSRFFPEEDDSAAQRDAYSDTNLKANEFLFRRVDLADAVSAHVAALTQAPTLGFGRYIISATTPFARADLAELRNDAPAVVARYAPDAAEVYATHGFTLFPGIGRVYVNAAARQDLGWQPEYDFHRILEQLRAGTQIGSPLAHLVGAKGYHATKFSDGPYPVT